MLQKFASTSSDLSNSEVWFTMFWILLKS